MPMICSSLNRERFVVRLLSGDGLYSILEEFSGLTSLPDLCTAANGECVPEAAIVGASLPGVRAPGIHPSLTPT